MGWESRHGGRLYLYRNRRVNGKPVKEYLAAASDPFGFGELMALDLERLRHHEAQVRELTRKARADFRERIDGFLSAVSEADAGLRTLAEGLLAALGYHRHHRGEWRMRKELDALRGRVEDLKKRVESLPLVKFVAPATDAEAVELFAKARAGEPGAAEAVGALIRERGWADWVGDLGRQATRQLIRKAAGDDPVWAAGITEKAEAMRRELLGANPTVLEELLVRRVVNGWIATQALELELTVRPPADLRSREYLDRALTRAQKRLTSAAGELARVRRLRAPKILASLNVAATRTVVNAPSGATAGS